MPLIIFLFLVYQSNKTNLQLLKIFASIFIFICNTLQCLFFCPSPRTTFDGWSKSIYISMCTDTSSLEWSQTVFDLTEKENRSLTLSYLTQRAPSGWGIGSIPYCTTLLLYTNVIVTKPQFYGLLIDWRHLRFVEDSLEYEVKALAMLGRPLSIISLNMGVPMYTQ